MNFTREDREYAQREFEAYIGFALNAFRGIGCIYPNGACAESSSLPQQWNKINKEFEISVPDYYWGPNIYNHLINRNNLVYSSIYNYFNWSINSHSTKENHIFCFEKPRGEPVFILSIGSQQLITADITLSCELKNSLKRLAERINKSFNHFISEILIFIDGESLNFGCLNPEIIKSNRNKNFDDFVCTNLLGEFQKCIN